MKHFNFSLIFYFFIFCRVRAFLLFFDVLYNGLIIYYESQITVTHITISLVLQNSKLILYKTLKQIHGLLQTLNPRDSRFLGN